MNDPLQNISLVGVAVGFVPVAVVLLIMYHWSQQAGTAIYAVARMLIQLLIIGYLLTYIFEINHGGFVLLVLTIMLVAACWISLRPVSNAGSRQYAYALAAIAIGGVSTLFLVTGFVLEVTPWFSPRHVIPLGGMIFAGSMNAVSLAAERYSAERHAGVAVLAARQQAFHAALIPTINSLFAVGLVGTVFLPGTVYLYYLAALVPAAIVLALPLFASPAPLAAASAMGIARASPAARLGGTYTSGSFILRRYERHTASSRLCTHVGKPTSLIVFSLPVHRFLGNSKGAWGHNAGTRLSENNSTTSALVSWPRNTQINSGFLQSPGRNRRSVSRRPITLGPLPRNVSSMRIR